MSRKNRSVEQMTWQRRYEALAAEVFNLGERVDMGHFERKEIKIPDECDSASDEFFISNDMHVVDNERYALKHWGPGKYFRVVKSIAQRETE